MAGAEVHRSALRTAGDVASQLGPPEPDSARRARVKELALWFNQEQRATWRISRSHAPAVRVLQGGLASRPDARGVWEAGGRQAQSVTCGSRDLTQEAPAIADRRSGGSVLRMFSGFTQSHRGGTGSPLLCLHGFMDTWRTWELVLPMLERQHDVLALTLPGHAGGPSIDGTASTEAFVDAVERSMDAAGLALAHLVGNSLGGYVAFQLAARGRAASVVTFEIGRAHV